MALDDYAANRTGLLLVDTYNDLLSEGGKLWPKAKAVADAVNLWPHLRALVDAARRAGVPRTAPEVARGRLRRVASSWPVPDLDRSRSHFRRRHVGGDWHPDLVPRPGGGVVRQHWGQSGFAGTDFDLQLKQRAIEKIIVAGMPANTCVEATARSGAELGYHVTLVRDTAAAFSPEPMRAAHEINRCVRRTRSTARPSRMPF